MSWTEKRVKHLKQLWATGLSASQIGKQLGVSKNAVVGKVHRMELPARPSPIKRDDLDSKTKRQTQGKGRGREAIGPRAGEPVKPARKAQVTPDEAVDRVGNAQGTDASETGKKVGKVVASPREAVALVDNQRVEASEPSAPTERLGTTLEAVPSASVQTLTGGPGGVAARRSQERSEEESEAADRRLFSGAVAGPRSNRGPKCLWPIGDPVDPDFHFCGAPAVHGKPYCAEHCARAYITRNKGETVEAEEGGSLAETTN